MTGKASCPEGDAAVGGGASITGDVAAFSLNDSYPVDDLSDTDTVPDDGWRVHLDYAGQGGDNVTYSVMCLGDTPPAYRSKVVTVPASGSVKTQALCPKGRPAVGGGVFVTGTADKSHLVASRPWDSGDAGKVPEDGWRGGVVNDSGEALSMTVHAICR